MGIIDFAQKSTGLQTSWDVCKGSSKAKGNKTFFRRASAANFEMAEVRRGLFSTKKMNLLLFTGAMMEEISEKLLEVQSEIQKAKHDIQKTYGEIMSVYDQLMPRLAAQLKEVRSSRMSISSEIAGILSSMKDVRKFFVESDYKNEMERMQSFVAVCRELRRLKDDGTLDALCDTAIKLALKEGA